MPAYSSGQPYFYTYGGVNSEQQELEAHPFTVVDKYSTYNKQFIKG